MRIKAFFLCSVNFCFLLFRCVIFSLSAIYAGLLYGLYVPDWEFKASTPTSLPPSNDSHVYMVRLYSELLFFFVYMYVLSCYVQLL